MNGFSYVFLQDGTTVFRAGTATLEIGSTTGTSWRTILPSGAAGIHLFQASYSGSKDSLSFFDDSGNLRISTDKGTTWSEIPMKSSLPASYRCSPDGQKFMVLYVTNGADLISDLCDIYTSQNQGLTFKHYHEELAGNASYWQARMSQDGQHFFLTSRYSVRELAGF